MAGQLFPAKGSPILLSKPAMILGRAAGCDIVINEKVVSNRHCMLLFDWNNWTVMDLGSTNGTETKGQAADDWTPLPSGSTLILARRLRFVIEYVPDIERARFSGATLDEKTLSIVKETHGYGEFGPATTRLSGKYRPFEPTQSQ
jgi:pSer/pThr/pTyr-binding forkhead associated (FHA) protein